MLYYHELIDLGQNAIAKGSGKTDLSNKIVDDKQVGRENPCTVKSCNYKSWKYDMVRKYNRIIEDAEMEVSIEKSLYNDESRYFDGFSADYHN